MGNRLQRLVLTFFLLLMTIGTTHCASSMSESDSDTAKQSEVDKAITQAFPAKKERPTTIPFIWPLKNHSRVTREFGYRHDGMDIAAPKGTNIYTAASGRVVYAGHLFKGYGNMILIQHNASLSTIYGHCTKLLVKTGQFVQRNAIIGTVGKTGRASAPHLHFEMRLNKKPVNPRNYLP